MSAGAGGGGALEETCWRDEAWLRAFPLTALTVMDYFALSPFYQGVGCEHCLSEAQEPHLFVVERRAAQRGEGGRGAVQAVFYVMDSVVFQAPTVQAVLEGRLARCVHHLRGGFGALRELGTREGEGGQRPAAGAVGTAAPDLEWERKMDRMVGAVLQRYAAPDSRATPGKPGAPGAFPSAAAAPNDAGEAAPMEGIVEAGAS